MNKAHLVQISCGFVVELAKHGKAEALVHVLSVDRGVQFQTVGGITLRMKSHQLADNRTPDVLALLESPRCVDYLKLGQNKHALEFLVGNAPHSHNSTRKWIHERVLFIYYGTNARIVCNEILEALSRLFGDLIIDNRLGVIFVANSHFAVMLAATDPQRLYNQVADGLDVVVSSKPILHFHGHCVF